MKQLATTLIVALSVLTTNVGAQMTFGLKAGISPATNPQNSLIIVNRSSPIDEFTFNTLRNNNGISAGIYARKNLAAKYFWQIEALYNYSGTDYEINLLGSDLPRSESRRILSETMHQVDVPLSFGADLGLIEVSSGFTAHVLLDHSTDLGVIPGYGTDLNTLRFGWHMGVNTQLNQVNVGLRFTGDFDNYGSHMRVNGQNLGQYNSPGTLMASISYDF